MKRHPFCVTALAVALCLSGGLSGCEVSQPADKVPQIKIGMTLYKQDDTFIATIRDHFERTAKKRETQDQVKITVNVMDGKGNQSIQNDQVDKFLSQGYDVLCVNEVDRTAASTIIDKAKAANIPIVFFNREPVSEDLQRWDQLYYVGSDASESGEMQGNIVVNLWDADIEQVDRNGDGRLQYVMLEGEPGHQDAAIRTEYTIKTLTMSGIRVEKLANDTANWQRGQASAKTAQWMEEFGDTIEVIFSNNDDMALGAIDAYKAAQITDLPVIVGIDGTPPALEAVRAGTLAGTVLNDSKGQAQAIFNIAYALATGADVTQAEPRLTGRYVWMPHQMITPETLSEELSE